MSCHPDLFELLLFFLFFKATSAPTTQKPPPFFLSFHLSLSLCHSFLHLSPLPAGGKTLLSHHPAADRHAKVVMWVIASLIDAVCLRTLAALL